MHTGKSRNGAHDVDSDAEGCVAMRAASVIITMPGMLMAKTLKEAQ